MLANLSTVDTADYVTRKSINNVKQSYGRKRKKKISKPYVHHVNNNDNNDNDHNNKTSNDNTNGQQPSTTSIEEENSAYDFDNHTINNVNNSAILPSQHHLHQQQQQQQLSSILDQQSINFLSRKDLLHYTKSIPIKVDATISLHHRSEDYIKLYHEVNQKKKSRKKDIYYWQGLNTQIKEQEIEDSVEFRNRFHKFYMDKKLNPGKQKPKVVKKQRRKNRAPSWFLPPSEGDDDSVKSVKKKERKPFFVRKYEKKRLVTTTWVDGPELARINATKAVSNREYMIGLLENHLLRCRVDGILYMDGPKKQFAKYLEIFGKIVKSTLDVCEKIKEWRGQLHSTAKIKYEKTWKVKVGTRPPFYWTYMRQKKGNAGKIRTTVNYMDKMIFDVGELLLHGMAELVGLLGHKNELLIGSHRANISGDFIKGIRVCPLLLPVPLIEVANGTAFPRSLDKKPTKTLEGWPTQGPARWYELDPEKVRFAATYMLEEEDHHAQIQSLKKTSLDALSTVLNDRGHSGRSKLNTKMSDLVAKNVLLTRDFEDEVQVNVALNEELIERKIERYKNKLKHAIELWREGVGDDEISVRKQVVENIKLQLKNMKLKLQDLKHRTTMVPVIS